MTRWSIITICVMCMVSWIARAEALLEVGKEPPKVVLAGNEGGKVTGGDWQSDSLHGKVHLLMYVDPDESELNSEFVDTLDACKFAHDRFATVAVVNMAATWMPNMAIEAKLKSKQERYPHAIYVKDFKKVLVQKWALADDNSDVLLFDKSGKLLFRFDGKLDKSKIDEVIRLIRQSL